MLLPIFLLAGCDRDKIRVYNAPKDEPPQMAAASENPHEARPEPARPQLTWKLPEGWKEEAPGGMAALKLAVPGKGGESAEVSAMQFPAKGLPMVALVNVVRQDAGLPAITEDELNRDTETVAVGSDKGSLIDLNRAMASSATNARVMLAVYPHGASTWFLKFSGDPAVVVSQKPAFIEFLKSLSITEAPAGMPDPHQGMPKETGINSAPSSEAGLPEWKVPADWQKMPLSSMAISAGLKAKYGVTAAGGAKAEINIGVAGGGVLMNINRWRVQQLGLPAATESDLPKLTASLDVRGGQAMLVDMTGTDAKTGRKARVVGIIVPQNSGTWFYKMMGDEDAVKSQNSAFVEFVKTVNYGNAH